jgi:hypothetical protein
MKNIFFIALILISTIFCNMTQAICDVAKLENTSYCEYDIDGLCCVVEYVKQDALCMDVWCYEYDSCAWEQELSLCN